MENKNNKHTQKIKNHATDLPTTAKVPCKTVSASGQVRETEEEIICERELEVSVNGTPVFRLTCTPEHLTELVLGRLCTERIIRKAEEVEHLFICGEGNLAEVRLGETVDFSAYTGAEPTCCTGNRQLAGRADAEELKPFGEERKTPDPAAVFSLAERFREDGALHKSTGGTHSCYIRLADGRILSFEDIGRHNALDKAVGVMLLEEMDPEDCMLYTTGRVAEDMVIKAVASRIPVLVSKAVPTEAAVRLAEKYGLSLICRAWPDSYSVYGGETINI